MIGTRAICAAMVVMAAGTATMAAGFRSLVCTWTNTSGGSWSLGANWDNEEVPDAIGEAAVIPDDGAAYTVILDIDPTIDYYECLNPTATLALSARTLTFDTGASWNEGVMFGNTGTSYIYGSFTNAATGALNTQYGTHLHLNGPIVTNDGIILVNTSQSSSSDSDLYFDADVLLTGSGQLRLNNAGPEATIRTADGMTVTNAASHSITGMGEIHGSVANEGTIAADVLNRTLDLTTGDKTNYGMMKSMGGGVLRILSCRIDQGPAGVILADTNNVQLQGGATIAGGILQCANAGVVFADTGTNTLQDLTNLGDIHLDYGTVTGVLGSTLINDGQILVNTSQSSSTDCVLNFQSDVTIGGAGGILLNNAGEEARIDSEPGVTITNGVNHLIHGMGQVRAGMVNDGVIDADVGSSTLTLMTDDKVNNALMQATNNGVLNINGMTMTQGVDGLIMADGGTVQLQNDAAIIGGTLDTDNGGLVLTDVGTVYLQDVTNHGEFAMDPGTVTAIAGSGLVNDGTLLVNTSQTTSSNTVMRFDSDVVLDGAGDVLLNNAGEEARIDCPDHVVTQEADHLIHGMGQVRAALINYGTVNADVGGMPLDLMTLDKTNYSTLLATNNGYLDIAGILVTQGVDGLILADGGTVRFQSGASVIGGTLDSSNGGVVLLDNGTLGIEDVLNLGVFHMDPATYLEVTGDAMINDGTILVNTSESTSSDCEFEFLGDCTLDGTGEIILNNAGNEARVAVASGFVLNHAAGHTIRGKGQIRRAVENYGTINADANGSLAIQPTEADPFVNHGQILVTGAGGLVISDEWFTNAGDVTVNETCELTASDGYEQVDGTTTVNGTLDVNGKPLELAGGALSGTGVIEGDVNATAGTVAPGLSAGTLTIAGAYDMDSCGELKIELGGYAAGVEHDVLNVTGTASLDGIITVELINDFIPQIGDSFPILNAASVQGVFGQSCPNFPDLPEGHLFVQHGAETVSLVVLSEGPVFGDVTWDGLVDIDDLFAVLANWGPCDCDCCPGDVSGDQQVDIDDVFAVLANWT